MGETNMKLHNVIGGLEEKNHICLLNKKGEEHRTGIDWKKKGHNQLCNREVEVDVDKIFLTLIKDYDEVDITGDFEDLKEDYPDLWEDAQELAKAISQGNVIKVKK